MNGAERPGGIPHETRRARVSHFDWAAHTQSETDLWLGSTPHRWEDGQLVLTECPEGNDFGDMRPRSGWVLIGWPDGAVTVAAPRSAVRVYRKSTPQEGR